MFRIFLAEDDPAIVRVLENQLSVWGYSVWCVQDFRQVMAEFRRFSPHLVLLDIGLPYRNGYHWCEEIRKVSQVPICFLSSASDNKNIIMAVNLAETILFASPLTCPVLLAKIQALLRRSYAFGAPSPKLEARGRRTGYGSGESPGRRGKNPPDQKRMPDFADLAGCKRDGSSAGIP